MNYVEHLNLFGVEAKEVPCIKGIGAPTSSTEGAVGCLYMDTDTGDLYKCTAVADGVYTWVPADSFVEKTSPAAPEGTLEGSSKIVGINAYGNSWLYGTPSTANKATICNLEYSVIDINDGEGFAEIAPTLRGIKNADGEWVARDEIIVKDGAVKYIQRIGELTLVASYSWQQVQVTSNHFIVAVNTLSIPGADVMKNAAMLCDHFTVYAGLDHTKLQLDEATNTTQTINLRFKVPLTVASSVATWKTWLTENTPQLLYVRNTPIETDITDTETGKALLSLLTTYDTPSWLFDGDMSVTYRVDTTAALDALRDEVNAELVKSSYHINAAEYGFPCLKLSGSTIGMNKDTAVEMFYEYGKRKGKCEVKWQGSSSLSYPKKNYTVKFDTAFEAVEGWGEQKKYCLKANYIDFSHARNVVSAKLWGKMVESRANVNETLAAAPNNGAIDGFPICLYINDEYYGLYTFNIPKDGWTFNMGNGTKEAAVCAEAPKDTARVKFRGKGVKLDVDIAEGSTEQEDFSLEFVKDEDDTSWVNDSLDAMIQALLDSDGSDMDTTLAQYIDWNSVIDYMIFTSLVNGFDCIVKNYILLTYDGKKWMFSAYDLDSTYGLYWNGQRIMGTHEAESLAASINQLAITNRAMELVKTHKKTLLKQRYEALRKGVLSEDNVITMFANFMGGIPKPMYDKECVLWKGIPSTSVNGLQQIADFYKRKCAVIDNQINAL